MKKLLILLLFISGQTFSQENASKSVDLRGTFSFMTFDFNFNDFFWAFNGGVEDVNNEWGAKLNFEFRPFEKKVQIRDNNSIIRQYQEVKYFVSIDVDKRFLHFDLWGTDTQFFIGAKTGFLFGNYKGTNNDQKPTFISAPMAGMCFNFTEFINLKVGYIYFSDGLVSVPDSRVTVGLNFIMQ